MKIKLKKLDINYVQYGEGKDIVLLHGWGQNIEMMKFLGDRFCEEFRITILDFPGYGESPEPNSAWYISDYCDLVHELVTELKIKNPILIGHSFGGRVAIKYASLYEVDNTFSTENKSLTSKIVIYFPFEFNTPFTYIE